MALTNCFECGKQISDKATVCPNCGVPIEKVLKEKVNPLETKTTENSKEIYTEESSSEPLSSLTSITIGWIFGILLSLGFVGALTSGNIATSFFYLIGALFLLPPVRKKVFQKTKLSIPFAYRIAIVIGTIFLATIALQRAESARADEATQNAKEKKMKEFLSQKNSLLKQVQRQVQDKNYENALRVCNKYMDLSDKDLSPLCHKVKDEVSKKMQLAQKKAQEEQKIVAIKEAARQEAELKVSMGSKAWKLHKKHPSWSVEDCKNVANNRIWIGMTYDMIKAQRGLPNSANPSNYGNGTQWQWCWRNYTPSCFYDHNDDSIIDSYN